MKKVIIIILSIVLIVSIIINVSAIFAIRYNYDLDKETVQKKTALLVHMNSSINDYHQLNNQLISKANLKSKSRLDSLDLLIDQTFEEIYDVRNRLITRTGGFNENGELMNPNSKISINDYFFSDNEFKSEGQKRIDNLIINYRQNYYDITSMIPLHIDNLYELSMIKTSQSLAWMFKDLTLVESLYVLDEIKQRIEMDRQRFIVSLI